MQAARPMAFQIPDCRFQICRNETGWGQGIGEGKNSGHFHCFQSTSRTDCIHYPSPVRIDRIRRVSSRKSQTRFGSNPGRDNRLSHRPGNRFPDRPGDRSADRLPHRPGDRSAHSLTQSLRHSLGQRLGETSPQRPRDGKSAVSAMFS